MIRSTWRKIRLWRPLFEMKRLTVNSGCHRVLKIVGSSLTLCAIPAASHMEIPNMDDYSTSKLLQNSSVASAESAAALLTYTMVALFSIEKEYTKGVYTLIKLIELRLENPGHPDMDKIDELIVETRINVKTLKKKRQDLVMLLSVCQRLVNDASEAAYMTGAEFAGFTSNSKLTSCETFLKPCELERETAESHLAEMEARVIEVESKRAKVEEGKIKTEEEVEDLTHDGGVMEKMEVEDLTHDGGVMEEKEVNSEQEVVVEKSDLPQTDSSPTVENDGVGSPKMSYVETFDIGSKDDSLDDD
ncbi:diablo IAP-binding mitochondrial protein-like [Ostrea edulis]|uniref:diablo IAP-binding mitochondrial protein-like n=1 Tax=Ostrea edulis TaxID=37623 RepID=UPI0024AEBF71|nr:diablo IAP-binding mitochondrial protein-like [Ostrea edulis]